MHHFHLGWLQFYNCGTMIAPCISLSLSLLMWLMFLNIFLYIYNPLITVRRSTTELYIYIKNINYSWGTIQTPTSDR